MYLAINRVADRQIAAIAEDAENAENKVRLTLEREGAGRGEICVAVYRLAVGGEPVDLDFKGEAKIK